MDRSEEPYDFGNPEILRRGMELWRKASQTRVMRQQPVNVFMHRGNFELLGLLYQLGSRIDCRKIYDEETKNTGWNG